MVSGMYIQPSMQSYGSEVCWVRRSCHYHGLGLSWLGVQELLHGCEYIQEQIGRISAIQVMHASPPGPRGQSC